MLTFEFTNLLGVPLGRVHRHFGGEVDLIHVDSATAKISLSVYDKVVKVVKPLSTMMRVFLDELPEPIFWGIVLTPMWKSTGKAGIVEFNAHDQSVWWKRNYHRYGDACVDLGYEVSGVGLRTLAESAIPLPSQIARSIPHPGIDWGTDTATGFKKSGAVYIDGAGPKPASLSKPVNGDGLWALETRGTNVMESIKSLQDIVDGPEWRLRPTVTLPAGYYAFLDTARSFGTDKTDTVVFHRGGGRKNNLDSYEWTPDGNAVRNYWVEVYPGGEENREDSQKKGLAHSEASWLEYGIYQGWESSGTKDSNDLLIQKAKAYVRYYKQPPNFFSIQPQVINAPRFKHEFNIGDTIRATCNDGYMVCDLTGRVTGATLTQSPKQVMTTTITCVPDIDGTEGLDDPGS